ncbi:MAG: iron chaperone [Blastocatellia bacterium]
MRTKQPAPQNMDEYIAGFPANVQKILEKIRKTIRKAAPDAEEAISYQIPAFKLKGNLIFFAAYKNHIGLYPAPRGSEEFKEELAGYEGGKGTVQFPLDKPIPYDLIGRITKFRVKQNLEKAEAKGKKK